MPALNIKNDEAYQLVKELAEIEGESMTAVVIEAVREKLERVRKPMIDQARVNRFLELGRRYREATGPESLAKDPFEDLYDEDGLPK